MCGIVGLVSRGTDPHDASVRRAMAAISHRGPDDTGLWTGESPAGETTSRVYLGHQRLAILDLSPDGHQPMHGPDGAVLIHNGEIYNYLELRAELAGRGHGFSTGTDTEVILAAYREWGEHCLERFIGMWAFALWDGDTLFLARDRLGQKPLWVSHDESAGRLAFASELGALLELPGVSRAADEETVYRYLAWGEMETGGRTFFRDAEELPPASFLRFSPGRGALERRRYWHLPEHASHEVSPREAISRTEDLLVESVTLRLRSDAPLGFSLSGGLDSTLLLAIAGEAGVRGAPAFSTGYEEKGYNENRFIDIAVRELSCESIRASSGAAECAEEFEAFLRHLGQPSRLPGPFSQWRVARRAGGAVKVLVDGQGADEMAGGYMYYLPTALREARAWQTLLAAPDLAATVFANRHVLTQYPLALILERLRGKVSARRVSPLTPEWGARFSDLEPAWAGASGDLHAALLRSITESSLPALLRYGDHVSMAWGIENRCPFLDHRLVEWVVGLPTRYKIRGGTTKWVLRRVAEGRVPRPIVRRRVKMGFPTPFGAWLRGPLAEWAERQIEGLDIAPLRDWIDQDVLRTLFAQHRTGKLDHQALLWRCISLGTWARTSRPA